MNVYLIKLILILVFNICVNIYYINSGCKCCGNSCKTRGRMASYRGKLGNINNPQKNAQKLTEEDEEDEDEEEEEDDDDEEEEEGKEEEDNGDKKEGHKSEDDKKEIKDDKKKRKKDTNKQIMIEFNNDNNEISIGSKNLKLSSENKPECIVHKSFSDRTTFCKIDEDRYNLFTTAKGIELKNTPKNTFILFAVKTTSGKYYLGYCNNGNSVEYNGIFSGSELNQEIKILGNGCGLNNIRSMFSENKSLENIIFTNCFNTSNVTNMSGMFNECSNLKILNLSSFNTGNVTYMDSMFDGCKLLAELNVSSFNTNNVTNMGHMFNRCSSLKELNLNNFNTNNVTNMRAMFYGCSSLKELNLYNFNTNNVIDVNLMFFGCANIKKQNVTTNDEKVKGMLSTK